METPEMIFNLYYYYSAADFIITEVGCVTHLISGSDEEKLAFLHENFEADLPEAIRFPLPDGFNVEKNGKIIKGVTVENLNMLAVTGKDSLVFEKVFQHYNASKSPMILYTPVKDGNISIQATAKIVKPDTDSNSII